MEAAYVAAKRGHQVILCEKEAELGGILKSEQALPFKKEMYELSNTYALFARNAGVEIRTSVEVTPEYVEKESPDALIVAVGSQPLVPPIKGLDGDNVVIVNNYYLEKEKVTDQVVVFGGGLAGCECAIHLGQEGKQVHLVEMRTELAPDAVVWKFVLTEFYVKHNIIRRSVKKINAALTITAIIQDVYGECLSTLILH